ncbi:hypothetical protein FOZ61_006495 [Perkinsus olseni]|uniref:Uncharacterized protein n=1 Tax=Perkinsus olseni TaxID=32597 RepID=A0A7J6LDN7_PEROL|nr:hypothetical protein FOZ61_006495 [Perkinsus olseni]
MAFVFRSARDSNFDVNTATAELPLLGPGKYLGHADYTVKQRAVDAPFGIMSTKFVRSSPTERCSEGLSAEPSIEESRDSVSCSSIWADELKQRRQNEGRMVPFNSHGPRFRPWRAPHNIGPGEYEVPRAFGGGLIRSLSSPRVPQGRSRSSVQSGEIRNNAPSIPRPHQSYGYRESPTGDLVPYDSPSPALQGGSGLSRSMKFRSNRKDRKTKTTFGTCPRESICSNRGGTAYPGPGYYNPGAERTGLRRFCKQHSVFTQPSCRSRGKVREEGQPTPGPGHYEASPRGGSCGRKSQNGVYITAGVRISVPCRLCTPPFTVTPMSLVDISLLCTRYAYVTPLYQLELCLLWVYVPPLRIHCAVFSWARPI